MRLRLIVVLAVAFPFSGGLSAAQVKDTDEELATLTAEGSRFVQHVVEKTAQLKGAKTADEAEKMLPEYRNAVEDFMAFMTGHSQSAALPDFLIRQLTGFPADEISRAWQCIGEDVRAQDTEANRSLKKIVAEYGRLDKGQPAPLFATVDSHGDSLRLADYKGKTVLLDFWASWCGPCRANMPHVMELYRKYHDAGFEVICIATDDKTQQAWREAIVKDGTSDFHHVLRGVRANRKAPALPGPVPAASASPSTAPAAAPGPASVGLSFIPGLPLFGSVEELERTPDIGAKYAVHAMPTHYLIAAGGTIIGEMSGGLLEYHLRQIFGF